MPQRWELVITILNGVARSLGQIEEAQRRIYRRVLRIEAKQRELAGGGPRLLDGKDKRPDK
jgi:hypothetical protein